MKLYRYDGCGLPNVYLVNGFRTRKTAYGKAVSITNVEGLHGAIADHLVMKPTPLTPAEFRYLRSYLEMSQKKLGETLGLTDQTVANWEKGNTAIDKSAATLLRMLVREIRGGNVAVKEFIERANDVERRDHLESQSIKFRKRADTWQVDCHAA
jgi:putative transcriptional regulator